MKRTILFAVFLASLSLIPLSGKTQNFGNAAVGASRIVTKVTATGSLFQKTAQIPGPDVSNVMAAFTGSVSDANALNASVPTISAGPVSGAISACAGTASAVPNIAQFTVSGANLTGAITAAAPGGFEVSLSAASGYGSSANIAAAGGVVNAAVVYVRSSATAPAGNISGNIVLTCPGAASQTVAVAGSVNALPTVNPVPNKVVSDNESTQQVYFSGTADYYKWVNNTPGIGVPASGDGNFPTFIAINKSAAPIIATITVTPYFAGKAYIGADNDQNVSVINTVTNKIVATIPVGPGPESVAVSPDGNLAYFGIFAATNVTVINTATNAVIRRIPTDQDPWGVCVSPDGSRLYVAGASGVVDVFDAKTYGKLAAIKVAPGAIGITTSPDGRKIYVSSSDFSVCYVTVIDASNFQIVTTIPVGKQPEGLAVTPDGSQLYVANYWSNNVSVINTATNKVTATVDVGYLATGVAVSLDGQKVYVCAEYSNRVTVISTATNTIIAEIPVGAHPFGVAFTPDGTEALVGNADSGSVSIISTATNKVIDSVEINGGIPSGPLAIGNFIAPAKCPGAPITFTITVNPPPSPAILPSGSPSPLTTTYGTPSQPTTFILNGLSLKAGVLVTPPAGFEVSLDNKTFSPTLTAGSGGLFVTTTVYIRLLATAPVGTYSGNILFTSNGAPDTSLPMPASTVTPAPLIVTADDKSKLYGWVNPGLTASYKGYVNGETADVLTVLPALYTTAVTNSPIGQYPITASSASSPNYAITYVPGVLTIFKSIVVPNTFTPNGDGINDTWNIKYLDDFSNCTVRVFSRWGQQVYSSIGYGTAWDGTCRGQPLVTGTYYYIIDLKDNYPPLSGFVAIIR